MVKCAVEESASQNLSFIYFPGLFTVSDGNPPAQYGL